MNKLVKASLAELVGTFTLIFIGGAAVASGQGVVTAALAHGLILISIIFVFGHMSGAHVNSAVTIGLLIGGRIEVVQAVYYIVAQTIGAILGAIVLNIVIPDGARLGQTIGSLTADSVGSAALFEAILTFFLVSAVYQAAAYGQAGILTPLAIGLTLAGSILAGGTYTGASLNPQRTLGPALIAGDLSYLLPYLVGIIAGGIVAGLVHTYIFKPDAKVTA